MPTIEEIRDYVEAEMKNRIKSTGEQHTEWQYAFNEGAISALEDILEKFFPEALQ